MLFIQIGVLLKIKIVKGFSMREEYLRSFLVLIMMGLLALVPLIDYLLKGV